MAPHRRAVRQRDLEAIVSASGTIQPKRSVNVSADTMGRVTELAVEEGRDEAEEEECAFPGGGEAFEITVGVSGGAGAGGVRWVVVGWRCPACGRRR